MRSVVARFWGGHPFEEKYLNIAHEQLLVLYRDALKQTREDRNEKVDLYNTLIRIFGDTVKNNAHFVALVSNPEIYKIIHEAEELKKHREEISDEQFMEEFNSMIDSGFIPSSIDLTLPGDIQEEEQIEDIVIDGLKTFDASLLQKMADEDDDDDD